LALLTLAGTEPSTFIDELLNAVDNPDAFLELLERTAKGGRAATLALTASYGLSTATSRTGAASCLFFLAVAAILDQDTDHATDYVTAAHKTEPDARDTWIGLAARIGAHQPETLKLIRTLINPLPTELETP
jgi:hypothetical protein